MLSRAALMILKWLQRKCRAWAACSWTGFRLFCSVSAPLTILMRVRTGWFQEPGGKARGRHVPAAEGQASSGGLGQRFHLQRIQHPSLRATRHRSSSNPLISPFPGQTSPCHPKLQPPGRGQPAGECILTLASCLSIWSCVGPLLDHQAARAEPTPSFLEQLWLMTSLWMALSPVQTFPFLFTSEPMAVLHKSGVWW